MARRHPVDEHVVHEGAVGREQSRVLRLADLQRATRRCRRCAATAASAFFPAISISPMWLTSKRPARVRTAMCSAVMPGVLDGHVPAGERHHAGVGSAVARVQRCFTELCDGRVGHAGRRNVGSGFLDQPTLLCAPAGIKNGRAICQSSFEMSPALLKKCPCVSRPREDGLVGAVRHAFARVAAAVSAFSASTAAAAFHRLGQWSRTCQIGGDGRSSCCRHG